MDYATFETMCLKCTSGSFHDKEQCEKHLFNFVEVKANLPQITEFIYKSENESCQFVLVEIINKIYCSSAKTGPIEASSYYDKENKEQDENFEINQNLVGVYMNFLSQKGSTLPNYLLNTIANYIGNALRVNWLEIKCKKSLMENIANHFFNDQNDI